MSFSKVTKVNKSRKYHCCEQCPIKIPKGYSYVRYEGVFDNDFFSLAYHEECWKKWEELNTNDCSSYNDEWYPIFDIMSSEEACEFKFFLSCKYE